MDFLKKHKIEEIGAAVLLVLGYVYFAYFSGSSSPTLTSSDTTTTLSQNLLVTLNNLHTIKLDNSIFTDPAFESLTDFGVTIPAESVGRGDPFAPATGGPASNNSITLPPSTN